MTPMQVAVAVWLGGGVLSYVYELAIVRYAPSHMTVNARRVHQDARDNLDPVVMFITLLLVAAACGPLWLFIDLWHDVPIMYRHWFPRNHLGRSRPSAPTASSTVDMVARGSTGATWTTRWATGPRAVTHVRRGRGHERSTTRPPAQAQA